MSIYCCHEIKPHRISRSLARTYTTHRNIYNTVDAGNKNMHSEHLAYNLNLNIYPAKNSKTNSDESMYFSRLIQL